MQVSIDGAAFTWVLYADTSLAPSFVSIEANAGVTGAYFVDSRNSTIIFTDRPMNTVDITVGYSSPASMQINIENNATASTNWDRIFFGGDVDYYLDGPLVGLVTCCFSFVFPTPSYWPDFAAGPLPGPIDPSDIAYVQYGGQRWRATDNSAFYEPTNLRGLAQLVPIPPAVSLLASALGLLGWVKRPHG